MKYFLMILFVTIMASVVRAEITPEQLKKLEEMSDECLKESGATKEMMEKAHKGEFTDDPKFKEQLLCIAKKHGMVDEQGNQKYDEIKKDLINVFDDEGKAEQVMKKCFQGEGTPQEIAYESSKCFFEEYKQ